jgi:CheY-like chemotaxis protein
MAQPVTPGQKLVLIVEDEPDNREIMRTVVEELLGLRAVLSANGEASIELAESLRPDVILMDLMMPVLDGFEAITRLRSNPATASIPIIAVTALGRPTDRQRALDIGATDYLSKPFDLDTLTETIGRYVGTADAAKSET